MRKVWSVDGEVEEKSSVVVSDPQMTVEVFDNHVYFYSQVNTDRGLAVMRELRGLDSRLRVESASRDLQGASAEIPIWLHINSGGGDLFTAFAIADQIQQLQSPVYSVAEGLCASAATIISTACHKRYAQRSSFMLVHQFSAWMYGTHEEFQDEMILQKMLMDRLVQHYVTRTKLSEEEIREHLKHNTWMDADQALNFGFVDEIKTE